MSVPSTFLRKRLFTPQAFVLVFRHVITDVMLQRTELGKYSFTPVAFVRLLFCVNPSMVHQCVLQSEGLLADVALVCLYPGVNQLMSSQIALLCERRRTVFTLKQSLSGVYAQVYVEAASCEPFFALTAFHWLTRHLPVSHAQKHFNFFFNSRFLLL